MQQLHQVPRYGLCAFVPHVHSPVTKTRKIDIPIIVSCQRPLDQSQLNQEKIIAFSSRVSNIARKLQERRHVAPFGDDLFHQNEHVAIILFFGDFIVLTGNSKVNELNIRIYAVLVVHVRRVNIGHNVVRNKSCP